MNNIWNYIKSGKWLSNLGFWAIAILLILNIWYWKSCNKESKPVDLEFKQGKKYEDKEGKTHTVYVTQEVTKQQMKKIVDSIAKSMKGKNVQYITQTITLIDTQFKEVPVVVDSTKYEFKIAKSDPYLNLDIIGNWKTKKANVGLYLTDTLTHTLVRESKFLKSNELKVDIQHTNPYMNSVAGRSFILKERKSVFSLGVQVGYGYNGKDLRPYIGLGGQFNLINITTR